MTPTGDTLAIGDRAARPGSPGALGDLYVPRDHTSLAIIGVRLCVARLRAVVCCALA